MTLAYVMFTIYGAVMLFSIVVTFLFGGAQSGGNGLASGGGSYDTDGDGSWFTTAGATPYMMRSGYRPGPFPVYGEGGTDDHIFNDSIYKDSPFR